MTHGFTAIWIGFGFLAVYLLVKMMRRRQLFLIDLLKKHVEVHATWARRRDRVMQIAAAKDAEIQDTKANVVTVVKEVTDQAREAA